MNPLPAYVCCACLAVLAGVLLWFRLFPWRGPWGRLSQVVVLIFIAAPTSLIAIVAALFGFFHYNDWQWIYFTVGILLLIPSIILNIYAIRLLTK